jgi:hypothetical protein
MTCPTCRSLLDAHASGPDNPELTEEEIERS